MTRILFVDDDPHVLRALENLMRRQRSRWEMVFALGAEAALAVLSRGAFDVVISDIRMPGIDGAALLERVQAMHPATTRVVLSGQADPAASARAQRVAHRFLSKPCTGRELCDAIESACGPPT